MLNNNSLTTDNSKAGKLLNEIAQMQREDFSHQEDETHQKIRLKVRLNFYSSLKQEDKNWGQTKKRLKSYGLNREEIKIYIQNLEEQIQKTRQQLAALA